LTRISLQIKPVLRILQLPNISLFDQAGGSHPVAVVFFALDGEGLVSPVFFFELEEFGTFVVVHDLALAELFDLGTEPLFI
jgi:hypothetical protein